MKLEGLRPELVEELLERTAGLLQTHAGRGQTLTYLELADSIGMPGPHRIHRVTRLLEFLMEQDAIADRPVRAALVVSRSRRALPAPGFFDLARRLGLVRDEDEHEFHARLLRAVHLAAQDKQRLGVRQD